jgi:hypothetical protein
VIRLDRALVSAQEPSLGERSHAMHPWQQDVSLDAGRRTPDAEMLIGQWM